MKSTKEIKIADNVIQQVIGQDEAVEVIKKAALQVVSELWLHTYTYTYM